MLKNQTQPTSVFLNVKFVTLIYISLSSKICHCGCHAVGTRSWFSTWVITGTASASVCGMSVSVSLLHYLKGRACGQRFLASLAQRRAKKEKKKKKQNLMPR